MAATPAAEPPSRPEPGEGEITLGKRHGGLVDTLSPEAVERIAAHFSKGGAGGQAPPEASEDAAPPPPSSGVKATTTPPPAPATPKPEAASPKAPPAPPPATAAGKTPEPAPAPAKPEDTAKASPKQLREAYERAQTKLAELEASGTATHKQLAEAHTKLAETTEKLGTYEKRWKEEVEPLKQMHEQTAKQLQESLETIKRTNYTSHPEFHDRYVKPIVDVQQEAVQFIGELVVTRADGSTVPAGQEHLNYIIGAPNANEAAKRAEELFGNQPAFTGTLVNYRNRLRALTVKREEAIKNATLDAEKWDQAERMKQTQQREQFVALAQERERTYAAQHLQVPETDAELREALNESRSLADLLANGAPDMTPERWADTVARSRVEVMSAGVLRKQNARLAAEKAALEKELAVYRGSEPQVETRADTTPREPATPNDNILEHEADLKARLMQGLQKTIGRR